MIKDLIIQNLVFLVLATVATICNSYLDSEFLLNYLQANIVTILIAFLGVSVATLSIVSAKLKEVMDKYNADMSSTIRNLRFSIKEQLFYITFGVILSVLIHSSIFMESYEKSSEIMEVLFIYIFIASLYNLYDTANAVFVIFEWEAENSKE